MTQHFNNKLDTSFDSTRPCLIWCRYISDIPGYVLRRDAYSQLSLGTTAGWLANDNSFIWHAWYACPFRQFLIIASVIGGNWKQESLSCVSGSAKTFLLTCLAGLIWWSYGCVSSSGMPFFYKKWHQNSNSVCLFEQIINMEVSWQKKVLKRVISMIYSWTATGSP